MFVTNLFCYFTYRINHRISRNLAAMLEINPENYKNTTKDVFQESQGATPEKKLPVEFMFITFKSKLQ